MAMEFYPRENNFTLELPVTNIMSDIGRQCWDTLDGNIGVMLLKIAHLGAGGIIINIIIMIHDYIAGMTKVLVQLCIL